MKPYDAIAGKLARNQIVILDGSSIRATHEDYLHAGAEVIRTNSSQLTRRAFSNHFRDMRHLQHIGATDLPQRADDLLAESVILARKARESVGPAVIAGTITTLEWCFRPDLSPEDDTAAVEYTHIARIIAEAGADLLLIETVSNVAEAAQAVQAGHAASLPVWVSFVCDSQGALLSGESLEKAQQVLTPLGVEAILLNCAPPVDVEAGLKKLLPSQGKPIGAYPHIGRFDPPEWLFTEEYPPARYAECCQRWAQMGARILGGCCGTTPEHIKVLAAEFA